jgi:S1-C subfamily serine protease
MKSLWLILILLLAVALNAAAIPTTAAQDQLPELVRRIKPSAVAIETFDSRGEKLSRGSGFFIDSDRVVTNRHVIDNAYRAEVHSYNGSVYPVKGVIAVDAEGDLALLRVDAPPNQVRPLLLDRTSPQEGESVVVIGNPFGLEGSVGSARHSHLWTNHSNYSADFSWLERQSGSQHAGTSDRRGDAPNNRRSEH